MAIQSFADKGTKLLFETGKLGKLVPWRNIRKVAFRKLDMIHYSAQLCDLKSPPGNRLKALSGGLKGCYSIRINEQWRIIFKWGRQGPEEVRIADYH